MYRSSSTHLKDLFDVPTQPELKIYLSSIQKSIDKLERIQVQMARERKLKSLKNNFSTR